jgi:hypothetical protein
MNLVEESRSILRKAGYRVLQPHQSPSVLYFEDESVYGFVSVFPTTEEIIANWKEEQDGFLKLHVESLRTATGKAWNAYSIFLTEARPSPESQAELLAIEEDFRGTRKVARSHLKTSDDVHRALFPVLPIGNLVTLQAEDLRSRLRQRLGFLNDKEIAALLESGDVEHLVSLFLENK